MAASLYRYVIIDSQKYVVAQGTYIRRWTRSFSSQLAANIIRLNFVDRGPGIRVYSMTLLLTQWASDSAVFKDGVTLDPITQMNNLEASYAKVSTPIGFTDPLGNAPGLGGVYFTNMNQIIPNHSTPQKVYIQVEIELTEATQVVV